MFYSNAVLFRIYLIQLILCYCLIQSIYYKEKLADDTKCMRDCYIEFANEFFQIISFRWSGEW